MPLPSLFESYTQPENQLTNALAQTLGRDPGLAAQFASEFTRQKLSPAAITVETQARPREMRKWFPNLVETPDPTRPDAWLSDGNGVVVIESKIIPGTLRVDQLLGHCRRLPDGGSLLILTPDNTEPAPVSIVRKKVSPTREIVWRSWQDIYAWSARMTKVSEPRTVGGLLLHALRSYLETLDMIGFAGIDLSDGFEYARAKSLLRALATQVVKLAAKSYPGLEITRKQIREDRTEQGAKQVWLALGTREDFTSGPHFSLALLESVTSVAMTVPNGSRRSWRLLRAAATDGSLAKLLEDLRIGLQGRQLAAASVDLYQRHWSHGRRARPDWLGGISRSLASSRTNPVLHTALLDALQSGLRPGNWEMQVRVDYSNANAIVASAKFAREVADTLGLFKPLYSAVGG